MRAYLLIKLNLSNLSREACDNDKNNNNKHCALRLATSRGPICRCATATATAAAAAAAAAHTQRGSNFALEPICWLRLAESLFAPRLPCQCARALGGSRRARRAASRRVRARVAYANCARRGGRLVVFCSKRTTFATAALRDAATHLSALQDTFLQSCKAQFVLFRD